MRLEPGLVVGTNYLLKWYATQHQPQRRLMVDSFVGWIAMREGVEQMTMMMIMSQVSQLSEKILVQQWLSQISSTWRCANVSQLTVCPIMRYLEMKWFSNIKFMIRKRVCH